MSAIITAWAVQQGGQATALEAGPSVFDLVADGFHWVHLEQKHEDTKPFLAGKDMMNDEVLDALLSPSTRPRCESVGAGVLLNLRGVNLNPGADPQDMISARFWITDKGLITLRTRRMMAFDDLRQSLAAGKGPFSIGDVIAFLVERLTARMARVLEVLDETLTVMEDDPTTIDMSNLSQSRQEVVRLRRYLSPQRVALANLANLTEAWVTEDFRQRIRQSLDVVTRYVEELDELKERAVILVDMHDQAMSGKIEHTMYMLSVIAGIFLPLGFITGLLGINVGGMPGVEDKNAFWLVTGAIVIIGLMEYLYLRWKKWM